MEMEERPLLRVEDALMYLDQVKVEFGDRPQIYNEFLDIMKTFKTQQIDTPGVIRRVSNLFQGNRRLVLGFNTFLPDGYRIEVPPDGTGPPVAVYRAPGSDAVHILRESPESEAVSVSQVVAAANAATLSHLQRSELPPQLRIPPQQPPGQHAPPPPPLQLQSLQPPQRVPSILPTDAGGVALRVPRSGADPPLRPAQPPPIKPHPAAALPGGVAPRQPVISNINNNRPQPPAPPVMRPPQASPSGPAVVPPPPPMPPPHPPSQNGQQSRQASGSQGSAASKSPEGGGNGHLEFDHAINYVTTIKRRFSSDPGTYKKFLEILHTYQKEQRGIKEILEEVSELFEDHPDLLREFTFFLPDAVQNQAKVQLDQLAKEAEDRKRSRAQAAIMNTAQNMRQAPVVRNTSIGSSAPSAAATAAEEAPIVALNGRTQQPIQYKLNERETSICREVEQGRVRFDAVRPPRKNAPSIPTVAQKNGRPRMIPEQVTVLSVVESTFFEDVKSHLNRKEFTAEKSSASNKVHSPYAEFLKYLHLFGAGFMSKEEFLHILKPLFCAGHFGKGGANESHETICQPEAERLIKLLEKIMISRGPYGRQEKAAVLKSQYAVLCTRTMNYSQSSNPTPSYRSLPDDYPHVTFGKCEGRKATGASLLNDRLVCISPELARVGEIESRYTHKKRKADYIEESNASKRRHNAFEENLFRIEDERFELDMAMERNLCALRKIEPLAVEARSLSEREEKDGQPIGRLRYQLKSNSLNSLHVGAIGTIYDDRAEEVLQYLSVNPLVALPVIHKRLKQKSMEWKLAKAKLERIWKEETKSNYEGSFDVRCYFYRRALEKFSSVYRLVDHCKKVRMFINHPEKLKSSPATEPFLPTFHKWSPDTGSLFYQPYLEVKCAPEASHKFAFQLITHCIQSSARANSFERERISRIWAEFVVPWFQYPTSWVTAEIRESFTGKMGAGVAQFACGQVVVTIFGEGTIAAFNDASRGLGPAYRVKLPFGLAFLSPSAILFAKPSKSNPHVRSDGLMIRDDSIMEIDNGGARLAGRHQVLFGTETTYIFLRLYTLLSTVLREAMEHHRSLGQQLDPQLTYAVPPNAQPPVANNITFSSMLTMVKKVVSKRAHATELESIGRRICRNNVHLIACLPKLVDRCADALLKVSEEDTLLHLYDFCQHRSPDVAALRAQCLTAVPDATYRIQYDSASASLRFGHQEIGPFPTTPPAEEDFVDEDTNMDTGDDMMEDEDAEFDSPDGDAATSPEQHDVNDEKMTGVVGEIKL